MHLKSVNHLFIQLYCAVVNTVTYGGKNPSVLFHHVEFRNNYGSQKVFTTHRSCKSFLRQPIYTLCFFACI